MGKNSIIMRATKEKKKTTSDSQTGAFANQGTNLKSIVR